MTLFYNEIRLNLFYQVLSCFGLIPLTKFKLIEFVSPALLNAIFYKFDSINRESRISHIFMIISIQKEHCVSEMNTSSQ